jgi:hypothetical protein
VPLTIGPLVAAIGLILMAMAPRHASLVTGFLPGITVLGLGMAITVAPLTTTVMNSADVAHSGAASGVNNAVARVAGLVAIAGFGIVVAQAFETRMFGRLEKLALPTDANAAVVHALPRMAGVDVNGIQSLPTNRRGDVRDALDASFSGAYRLAMLGCAALALVAGGIGVGTTGRARGGRATRAPSSPSTSRLSSSEYPAST